MSSLYASARQTLLTAGLTWTTARVFATLIGAAYVPNFETDTTVGNIPATAILAPSVALEGLTAEGGYAGSAPTLPFGTITTASAIEAILLTLQPGAAQAHTDPLLLLLNEGVGFGAAATNTPVIISWNVAGIWRP